jgi:hypothetical protein
MRRLTAASLLSEEARTARFWRGKAIRGAATVTATPLSAMLLEAAKEVAAAAAAVLIAMAAVAMML